MSAASAVPADTTAADTAAATTADAAPTAVPTLTDCDALDAADPVSAALRARFAPGEAGTLHLDANSIGPMPLDAPARMARLLDDGWRIQRRRGWNDGDWLEAPRRLGAALAPLIGAGADDVLVCDSTSINLYKALRHALAVAAPRRVLVVEADVFPTNRYVAEGLARAGLATLRLVTPGADAADAIAAALAPGDVAAVALSHVDYRSSRRLDSAGLTALAHRHGALAVWDLSHSAGAVAIDLAGAGADYAVASGYKYLCGGPGAPALLYVRPDRQDAAWPAICGWMGHADTFAFTGDYAPGAGVARQLAGTPAVVANVAFGAAADIWRTVDPTAMNARHRSLTDLLIRLLDARCDGLDLTLASPRSHAERGGHIAVRHPAAAALGQALIEAGVVVSVRKPDALRFGVHPLVTTHRDLWIAVDRLHDVLASGRWRDPAVAARAGV